MDNEKRDKYSPLNFTQYAVLPPQHRDRNVTADYRDVTSPYVQAYFAIFSSAG